MGMGITNYFTKLRIPGCPSLQTIYFLRHSTDPVHTATLANDDAQYSTANATRRYVGEFCRWERRIRPDQDCEHDIFRKIDRQHKYTGLSAESTVFIPIHPDRSDPGQKAAGWARDRVAGHELVSGWRPSRRWWRPRRRPRDDTAPGCSGFAVVNGTLDLHVSLEQELALFLGKPAACCAPPDIRATWRRSARYANPGDKSSKTR